MSNSIIVGWNKFYKTGDIVVDNVNKAFIEINFDHVAKINSMNETLTNTTDDVKTNKDDIADINIDIDIIKNNVTNINNTVTSNNHNPRFTGTMVMDGDIMIGGTMTQGGPVPEISTPMYSNTNEYDLTTVNNVLTDSNIIIPTYSRSWELSFKNNSSTNGNYTLITTGNNNGTYNSFYFDYTNNNIVMNNGNNDFGVINYNINNIFDNNYHHFIATLDVFTKLLTIYIDGVSIGTFTFNTNNVTQSNSSGIRIGSNIDNINNDLFNGYIKNIHVHNKYLSTNEITERYNLFLNP